MAEQKTVITLMCERAADVNDILDKNGECTSVDGVKVVKLPCSGMIQTLMIDAALKGGAAGVIVCGCQIGDCYYREGNKMIRERLLGERTPGLKKTVDRRRILALWLSRLQRGRFEREAKEFVAYVSKLEGGAEAPKPAPAAAPKVEAKPAAKAEETPGEKVEVKAAEKVEAKAAEKKEAKAEAKAEASTESSTESGAKPEAAAEKKADEPKPEEAKKEAEEKKE